MKRFFERMLLVVGCVMAMCVGGVKTAQALSVSPSIVEVQANPGETKTFTIEIVNDEAAPLQVFPSIQKFIPLGTSGQQQFLPPADVSGLPSWTFVGVSDRVLHPGEVQQIPVQIRVPTDASQGGKYEAVFFSAEPPVPGVSVGIRSRVGVLVLLTVGEVTDSELITTDWRLEDATTQPVVRGRVHVLLKNTGRTHVTPRGELVVRGMFGGEVARYPLNSQAFRVLPQSERGFAIEIGPVGGIGWYSISLEGVERMRTVPTPLRLLVVPWRLLAMGLGCLLIVGVAFLLYRRRLIRSFESTQPTPHL